MAFEAYVGKGVPIPKPPVRTKRYDSIDKLNMDQSNLDDRLMLHPRARNKLAASE